MVKFLTMSVPFPYKCIMGRSALNQFQALISTCDLSIEIPMGEEIHTIYGNQKTAQEYYFSTLK